MPATISLVELKLINTTVAESARGERDQQLVDTYAADMQRGCDFPPVEIFVENKGDETRYWCWDGWYRTEAHKASGVSQIACRCFPGTHADAVWASYGSNSMHGARRTRADLRRVTIGACKSQRGQGMTDRELARHVGVSHTFVATIRRELAQQGEIKPKVTRCKPSPNPASPTLSHGEAPQGIPPNDGAGWQLTPGGSESPEEDGEDKESAATEETAVPPGPPRPVPDPRLDDRIQDKVGNVVPRKAEEAFRRAHRIAKCKAALSQLKGQVKQLCEDPHVGVALHWPTIRTDLDNVIAALRFGEPYALCPYCHAKGCKVCHGEGWVGKFTYRQAPKDKE